MIDSEYRGIADKIHLNTGILDMIHLNRGILDIIHLNRLYAGFMGHDKTPQIPDEGIKWSVEYN